jgi:hypothetical protein
LGKNERNNPTSPKKAAEMPKDFPSAHNFFYPGLLGRHKQYHPFFSPNSIMRRHNFFRMRKKKKKDELWLA